MCASLGVPNAPSLAARATCYTVTSCYSRLPGYTVGTDLTQESMPQTATPPIVDRSRFFALGEQSSQQTDSHKDHTLQQPRTLDERQGHRHATSELQRELTRGCLTEQVPKAAPTAKLGGGGERGRCRRRVGRATCKRSKAASGPLPSTDSGRAAEKHQVGAMWPAWGGRSRMRQY